MQSICLSLHAHLTPEVGSKGQNIFFSDTSHVTYQIKGNDTYDNMKANILPLHTPSWVGFKGQNIHSSKSMLNIKMNMKFGHAHTMVINTMGGLGNWGFFNSVVDSCIAIRHDLVLLYNFHREHSLLNFKKKLSQKIKVKKHKKIRV